LPRLHLIEDLTNGPIPAGSQLLVEYDPTSQWYNASLTVFAGWLKTGGTGSYHTYAQPPDDVRSQLRRLGVDTNTPERYETSEEFPLIIDWYTLTTGLKSKESNSPSSLKVAEFSIDMIDFMKGPPAPNRLAISDDESTMARFNDEKSWIELELTRMIAGCRMRKITAIIGIMIGVHSEWAYRRLEGACDGVIDIKLEESDGRTGSVMRIRNMRNARFDSRWHPLVVDSNFKVTLDK
jgi:KaiC/GvpD/RAD55 family RecA-like ATPase